MPVNVSVIMRGAKEIDRGLAGLRATLQRRNSSATGRRLGREGLRVLRKLTPKQRSRSHRTHATARGFPPFKDRWEIFEKIVSDTAYEAVIKNRATFTPEGVLALASVEFGARPHVITPQPPNQRLVWRSQSPVVSVFLERSPLARGDITETRSVIGQRDRLIRAKQVQHPGMSSFHMVGDTRLHLQRLAGNLLHTYRREIERSFGRGFQVTAT